MKEFNPKSDLWEKIESRRDFESQLKDLTKNLPSKEPNFSLWNQIEDKLNKEKQVYPIWRFASIAASIILILALGRIFYFKTTSDISTPDLLSENSIPSANDQNNNVLEQVISKSVPKVEAEKIEKTVTDNSTDLQKQGAREVAKPILITKPPITSLDQDLKMVSDAGIFLSQPTGKSKTFHKVTISWGLHEKTKLRTQFGSASSDPALSQQLGRASEYKNSIKIKLKKE